MTHGETIILTLLYYNDRYGYELEKHIEQNMMRDWTQIGFSSIYSILNKLHKKGFIDYEMREEQKGPKRKVFHILDEGREAVQNDVIEMLKKPTIAKQDIDVGIVCSPMFDDTTVKEALIEYRARVEKNIVCYYELLDKRYQEKPSVKKLFRRAIIHMEADIKWVDEMLEEYE